MGAGDRSLEGGLGGGRGERINNRRVLIQSLLPGAVAWLAACLPPEGAWQVDLKACYDTVYTTEQSEMYNGFCLDPAGAGRVRIDCGEGAESERIEMSGEKSYTVLSGVFSPPT